jgi:hypothetical protein
MLRVSGGAAACVLIAGVRRAQSVQLLSPPDPLDTGLEGLQDSSAYASEEKICTSAGIEAQ